MACGLDKKENRWTIELKRKPSSKTASLLIKTMFLRLAYADGNQRIGMK
jgi:hypothetical protein